MQGCLPAGRSNRRQTTSQIAPLAANQASSDIQDGGADVQDDVLLSASIFEWPDPDSCSSSSSAVIRRPAADRPKKRELSSRVGLFRSWLRTLGTHYHPTLDPAVLWTPSSDTSRPIFSDSLNLTPPAPLYLRTLWRYTNAVIIIVIISVKWSYFARFYGWGATSKYRLKIGVFAPTGSAWPTISGRSGRSPPTNHSCH